MAWKKTNDFYNRDVVKFDVYSYKVSKRITIYLQDGNDYTFTVSAGANSQFSYTGCFFGHNLKNVEEAMRLIEKKHKRYFK